ncbi:MAG: hypothetical protein GY795_33810 [Desulfobacterales bacterium]|nr:hypothetical protein [Desulfobacterales bacterium]
MKFWHNLLYSVPKFHFGTPFYTLCVLCAYSVPSVVKKNLHSNHFLILISFACNNR